MAILSLVLAFTLSPAAATPETGSSAELVAPWQPTADASAAPAPQSSSDTGPLSPWKQREDGSVVPASPDRPVSQDISPSTPAAAPDTPPAPVASGGSPPDAQPVLRAAPGNWGMTFIFGGLGPLSVAGHGDQPLADGVIFTEIGVRRVFKRVVLPISFGAGITHRTRPGTTRPETAAGVSASIAVLKGFRVWRRIAPYFGAFLHAHYVDAPGPDNWLVNVSAGPILGIEYYLADRVSLYGQGVFAVGPNLTKSSIQLVAQAVMAAGGQLGLTFYF